MTDIRAKTAPLLGELPQARAGGGQAGEGLSRRNEALGGGGRGERCCAAPPESLNAAAPAPLRILLDAIDRLGRLDGWIGAGCLLTLTR